jgi:hypothetical protein
MTRASLLHIFNHVGSISEAEVRELEQLAAAFPYCQTAHLLLAKAAHDQGSMLASQRLRRAATYAVDRQLLRQLLEQPSPPIASIVEAPAPKELKAAETDGSALTPATGNSTAFFQALVPEDVQPIETQEEDAATNAEEVTAETTAILPSDESITATSVDQPSEVEQVAIGSSEPDAPLEVPQKLVEDSTSLTVSAEPIPVEVADISSPAEIPTEPIPTEHSETAEPTSAIAELEELLPPVAPPIRPPADAGISRFEFGLSESEDQLIPVIYQLPSLQDEGSDEEAEQEYISPVPTTATALAPPFRSDTTLAYSLLPEGSRLGYALQLQDEELTQPLPIAEFFPPDALLHAHATHQHQPAAPTPSSLDLINRFLKVQPRLKSPVVVPQVQEQTDLAARSTSAPPALASESLAKILIKQGKKDRAIEIYEQLMVRQPEKSAYFVDQILQLKTSE